MNYQVNISDKAGEDLRQIYLYIANTLMAPVTAKRQLQRLEGNILGLDYMPSMFKIYEKEPWRSRKLHVMPVDNYVVFYFIDEKEKIVTVTRVLYGRMDINKQNLGI